MKLPAAAAAVLLALLGASSAARCQTPGISAPGGVAAGTITGGTFNLQGLSEAQRQEIQERFDRIERGSRDELSTTARVLGGQLEASGAARAKAEAQAERLAAELNISRGAAVQLLAALGQKEVPAEQAMQRLQEAVLQYQATFARLEALQGARSPAVRAFREKARAAVGDGRFDEADRLSREAADAGIAAARNARALRDEAERAERELLVEAAADLGTRGDLALTRLDYQNAALHFAEAAALLPEGLVDERNGWLVREADAHQRHGAVRGERRALLAAVERYNVVLAVWTRQRTPLQWAATQNNLGVALGALGGRGDDAALPQAVAAYRAALEERTRDRTPLDWAMTQNNLGAALQTLGERGDDAALPQAVAAYRAALEEYTRSRTPLDWAMTQNNLGVALQTLGERGDDAALPQAVAAFRAALEEYTRSRTPLDWAMTQNNLGIALQTLGERGDDAALPQAVAAYRAALEERTREPHAARLGRDPEQPRRRAPDARRAGPRRGAAPGRRRLPRRPRGAYPRPHAARLGRDPE